jgi:hypothetical protein
LLTVAIVATAATYSGYNSFPDEDLHVRTASYYHDHWLPPAMTDDLSPYMSNYGVSYFMLWPPQAVYLLFEKLRLGLTLDHAVPWKAYRFLAVVLWQALVVFVLRGTRDAPAAIALVCTTSQLWYVFTYFNADSFSYVMTALTALQLARPESFARRYLATGAPLRGALFLGACFAGLALSKANYIPFTMFAVAVGTALLWREAALRDRLTRFATVTATCAVLAGPLLAVEAWKNQGIRSERFEQIRENFAAPGWKPSDIASGKAQLGLGLRARGVTFLDMFHRPWRWGELSARSFFGVYGQMDVHSPPHVNTLQALCFIALFAFLWHGRRREVGRRDKVLLAFGVACILLTVVGAFWRAWNFDFQAQGRYLFAIIPILVLMTSLATSGAIRDAYWLTATIAVALNCVSLLSALPRLG